MTAQDKATLKGYFETGDRPTAAQFVNLIDTLDKAIYCAVDVLTGSVVVAAYTTAAGIAPTTGSIAFIKVALPGDRWYIGIYGADSFFHYLELTGILT